MAAQANVRAPAATAVVVGGGDKERPPLVYALGTLSYDFGTQSRFDSIAGGDQRQRGGAAAPVGPDSRLDRYRVAAGAPGGGEPACGGVDHLDAESRRHADLRHSSRKAAYAAATYERLRKFPRRIRSMGRCVPNACRSPAT